MLQTIEQGYHVLTQTLGDGGGIENVAGISDTDFKGLLSANVESLLSCAPYMMGDIDGEGNLQIGNRAKILGAFFLLRGLLTANSVRHLCSGQRQAILDYFDRIGSRCGIQMALYAKNHWLANHHLETNLLGGTTP